MRIKRYRDSRKGQTGSGLASDLAKIGLTMGSKALNSAVGRKINALIIYRTCLNMESQKLKIKMLKKH